MRSNMHEPRFILSPQQVEALEAVRRWLNDPRAPQVFRLFGFAGTGKTEIARLMAAETGSTVFAAFTGKAASVMRKRGCTGADTLHSIAYISRPYYVCPQRCDEIKNYPGQCQECGSRLRRFFGRRPNTEGPLSRASLLVIDECSMVGATLANDILAFGVKVLTLGDTAQLPPIEGTGYFAKQAGDLELKQIHRQLRGNPIIRYSEIVRGRERPHPGQYGTVTVKAVRFLKDHLPEYAPDRMYLTGTNKHRQWVNREVRKSRGFTNPLPVVGDCVACLRNDREQDLLNGTLWTVLQVSCTGELVAMIIEDDDGRQRDVVCHELPFLTHDKLNDDEQALADDYDLFCFGYAMTVHKAQGSQWDDVVLYDEAKKLNGCDSVCWLYTGVTRAVTTLTVIEEKLPQGGAFR